MAKSLEFYIWVANDTLIGCNVQMALPTASPASLLRRGVLSRGPSLCVLAHRVVLQRRREETRVRAEGGASPPALRTRARSEAAAKRGDRAPNETPPGKRAPGTRLPRGACCWASWKWSERTASRFVSPPPFCSGDEQEITSKRPQASPGSAARSFPGAALRPAEGHGPRATTRYGQDAPEGRRRAAAVGPAVLGPGSGRSPSGEAARPVGHGNLLRPEGRGTVWPNPPGTPVPRPPSGQTPVPPGLWGPLSAQQC